MTSARMRLVAPSPEPATPPVGDVELRLLLEGIWSHYGFDFREYAPRSLRRRIRHFMDDEGLATVSALQERVLHDRAWLFRPLQDRVHRLLHSSLVRFGYLALGSKETVRFRAAESRYQELPEHIFRRIA